MLKFRRILLVVLFVLLCISMAGCGLPENCVACDHCNNAALAYSNRGYIAESDIEEYHNMILASYDIVNVVARDHYSGTMEGHEEADGFLIFYKSRSNISGSINEEETYEFYYQKDDGGYKKMSVPVDDTTIYYTNEHPKIEILVQYGEYWICPNCGAENYKWKVDLNKIYVPEGSIVEEYNLN